MENSQRFALGSEESDWKVSAMRALPDKEVEMSQSIFRVLGIVVLLGSLFAFGGTKEASAEVSVNINIGPPPIVVVAPPGVVMIPGLQVYFVPQLEFDVFFYNGYWWSPRGSQWYRARDYNGPWGVINKRYVPAPVHRVPRDYRNVYGKEKHIPYGQWKQQGKHREKEERKEMKEDKKEKKKGRGHDNKEN